MNIKKQELRYVPISNKDFFETQDFLLATSIMSENCTLDHIETTNNKRATFVFHNTRSLEKTVSDFYANKLLINPVIYEGNRKNLKSQLISQYK